MPAKLSPKTTNPLDTRSLRLQDTRTMKLPHYGYHASDNTLRLDGVRIAHLTTIEGSVLTVAAAKRLTDALNRPAPRVILVIEGGLPQAAYVSDPAIALDVLNRDYSNDPEDRERQEAEDAPLEAEIAKLREIPV